MNQTENIVQKQINQVREYINNPEKHYRLRQNKPLFLQLCSSLDVIRDTEEAIIAFKTSEFNGSKSILYLVVYGLFQAIYVQQDAINHLCASLVIEEHITNYPALKKIREMRNDTIGHPTKRDHKKGNPTSYHHISPTSLSQNSFTLLYFPF